MGCVSGVRFNCEIHLNCFQAHPLDRTYVVAESNATSSCAWQLRPQIDGSKA
jgi:hypothetical protein